jgi:hypothetical protein
VIDIGNLDLHYRGYPVAVMSEGVAVLIGDDSDGQAARLREIISRAVETAGPGEPSGWIFESGLDGTTIWIERLGGMRDLDLDRHDGGQWSVYLPDER